MEVNGSGIRDTARVLKISPTTVLEELKKAHDLELVNQPLLEQIENCSEPVMVVRVDEAEMDEMWSFVGPKKQQRWLWSTIDHRTGKLLADVLAPHEDAALLKALLQPFGVNHFYTDAWGAYLRLLDSQCRTVSKANTQKIERKHLTLRTCIKRLARRTICFSKSIQLHDIVIRLFINRYEFERAI